MTNKPPDKFLIRLAASIVGAIVLVFALLFAQAVFVGKTTVPEAFVARFWDIAQTLLVLAGGAAYAYFQRREATKAREEREQSELRIRQEAARQAQAMIEATRQVQVTSSVNAAQTQAVVKQEVQKAAEDIKEAALNGPTDITANKVVAALIPRIPGADQRQPAVPNDTGDRRRVSDADNLESRR